ncbi:MAG: TlpA disulfide reductase family protein [Candidatus Poribacteria bacterium]|nr:TlpA disulfide reductase family protein [Candidatus Poribacteria bacterium]
MRVILTLGIVLGLLVTSVYAEETSEQKVSSDLTEEQKVKHIKICTHNLEKIGKAIQAYHKEHGDYPEWLSDLHPEHLADANVLICPADKKDGEAIHPYTKDPKNAISYDYQLAPKFRKGVMETQILFGDVTPLVRCLHHNERTITNTLNLSFENKVYQAPYSWQNSPVKIYGSIENAVEVLEAGLQKMPGNARFFSTYPTLLKLYMKAERKEDAENLIDRFKTVMDSNNVYHYSYLGDMFREMNRHDEELQLYEELEKQKPKNRLVLERLEKIHKLRGNDELAYEYRKKYVPGLAFLGEMVPDFSATDLDGEPISIEAYRGKVVLVDFWAVWCGPCVAEMPNVKKVYEKYKDKGFDIIGISLDNDETSLRDYLKGNDIPWRQVFSGKGWQSPVAQQYGIYSIPNMWLIDKEGKLISNKARGEKLESMVVKALKEEPAE